MIPRRYGSTSWRRLFGENHGSVSSTSFQIRLSSTAAMVHGHGKSDKTTNKLSESSATPPIEQHPLAPMPTNILLRSLFISTVSSHRLLLIPSLHLLSFFARPGRAFPFNVDKNPILHGILKRTIYNQFCAGETLKETSSCVRQLKELGFKGVILTYAKELVFDRNTTSSESKKQFHEVAKDGSPTQCSIIEEWRSGTSKTVDLIEKDDILAVKMSGAGPAVADAFTEGRRPPQQFLDAIDEIATKCKDRGIQIIVDAESQQFQKGIANAALDLMRKFNREDKVVIYNTYQAYLKKTPQMIQQHMAEAVKDGFTLGVKVVRGAYMNTDDRSLIHDTKEDTDNAYNNIAQSALRKQYGEFGKSKPFPALNLFLASHNRDSVISAQRLRQQRVEAGLPTVPLAFGQLHGMSDEVSFSLLQEKGSDGVAPDVFKCSTWGSMGECIGYLLRRAVENRDAVLRTRDEYMALRAELRRRMSPF